MQITTSTGTMTIDDDAIPSIDDMNDIIASLTDGEAKFQALCDASTAFADGLTNEQFKAACEKWLSENS